MPEEVGAPAERAAGRLRVKVLVLGLGNPILRDDSIGLRVVRAVAPRVEGRDDVEVAEDYHGGLRLMERMVGYDRAIIVDALRSGAPPGSVHSLGPDDIPTQHSASTHDLNLPTALQVGRHAGLPLPATQDVRIIAIEAQDVMDFGEELTPEVEAAIPAAVEAVLQVVESWRVYHGLP
jgi:hydrogenase maturation protease